MVATFCHNISRNIDIEITNPEAELTLCYIDDVIDEFLKILKDTNTVQDHYCAVPVTYNIKLGKLADLIRSFKESRTNLTIPNMEDALTKKLYSTYLSFLPEKEFSYNLKMNTDHRGAFIEFLRTPDRGQVSVNVTKPWPKPLGIKSWRLFSADNSTATHFLYVGEPFLKSTATSNTAPIPTRTSFA